jgi:hypothetical protein
MEILTLDHSKDKDRLKELLLVSIMKILQIQKQNLLSLLEKLILIKLKMELMVLTFIQI